MKTSGKISIQVILAVIICFSCTHERNVSPKNCEELKEQGIIDSFPYPIRPGSDEWKNLKNQAEKYEAVSVPDEILQNMCTNGLVYTCVYCPLFITNLLAFNNIRSGFTSLSENINSFAELIDRPEAGKELYNYYKVLSDTTLNNLKLFKVQIQIYATEIFFSQTEFLSKLSVEELKETLTEAYDNLFIKEKFNMDKTIVNSSIYITSNILYYNLKYQPLINYIDQNNLINFLNDLLLFNGQSTDSLEYYTKKYIDESILN